MAFAAGVEGLNLLAKRANRRKQATPPGSIDPFAGTAENSRP